MSHNYKLKNGTTGTVDRFMQLPLLTAGYVWNDVSELGADVHQWVEQPEQPRTNGLLFGYEPSVLMARQYR